VFVQAALEKKRGRVRKKIAETRESMGIGGALQSTSSSIVGSQASVISHDLYLNDDDTSLCAPMFRYVL
jgi:hypothetical protein